MLAVLLNAKSLRFSNLWRAMYFTPVVTSTVAITLVFQILYNKDSGSVKRAVDLCWDWSR